VENKLYRGKEILRDILIKGTFYGANIEDGMVMRLLIELYDNIRDDSPKETLVITAETSDVATIGFSTTIELAPEAYADVVYRYDKVNISSMGIDFTGNFDGSMETFRMPKFALIFADGTIVDNSYSYLGLSNNDTDKHFFSVSGGDGDPYTGELTWQFSFAKAIDILTLQGIEVDGVYYDIDIWTQGD